MFFGSASNNFGVRELLDKLVALAPYPTPKSSDEREVYPEEPKMTGFVFKIHANLDPKHRDRVAFFRICSGKFERNKTYYHVRSGTPFRTSNPTAFMAQDRDIIDEAWPGDIIGLHDTGTFKIDHFALNELRLTGGLEGGNAPAQRSDKALTAMDIACDYADAGLFGDAAEMLCLVEHGHPMVSYLRGYFSGDAALYKEASSLDETYCFPYQDWEKVALEDAVRFDDGDTKAHLYLGNLLYGRCRLHEQAAFHWEHAGNSVQALRNLAVARFHLNSQDQTVPTLLNAALERDAANLQLMYERNLVLDLQGLDAWTRFAIWE